MVVDVAVEMEEWEKAWLEAWVKVVQVLVVMVVHHLYTSPISLTATIIYSCSWTTRSGWPSRTSRRSWRPGANWTTRTTRCSRRHGSWWTIRTNRSTYSTSPPAPPTCLHQCMRICPDATPACAAPVPPPLHLSPPPIFSCAPLPYACRKWTDCYINSSKRWNCCWCCHWLSLIV